MLHRFVKEPPLSNWTKFGGKRINTKGKTQGGRPETLRKCHFRKTAVKCWKVSDDN